MYLLPGQRLGSYEVIALLGVGGMGQVYRARDPRLERDIALKILQTDDAEHRKRFAREARAIAALNHPNIVTIHSVEEVDGQPFLTMELVEGTPLNRLIPPGGFELPELLSIAVPVAEALAAAHARGIVHRDLKPPNVMVGPRRPGQDARLRPRQEHRGRERWRARKRRARGRSSARSPTCRPNS